MGVGEGISQKTNGKYLARYRSKSGKRPEKQFDKIHEAKKWLAEQKYQEEHGFVQRCDSITVDSWFNIWMNESKKAVLRESTFDLYQCKYRCNIQPFIGNMLVKDVKPIHCQQILNHLHEVGHDSIAEAIRTLLYQIFDGAVDNMIISRNPINKNVVLFRPPTKERRVLSATEQYLFTKYLEENHFNNKDAFLFILETGLRYGEITGLKWENVDFVKRTISIDHQSCYNKHNEVVDIPLKTVNSIRTIPLTQNAINILKHIKKRKIEDMKYHSYCFLNSQNKPLRKSNCNKTLKIICRNIGIPPISLHILRHSFATRCIERGIRPKTLQKLLGHSKVDITMNLYVHATDESIIEEMQKFECGGRLMGGLSG